MKWQVSALLGAAMSDLRGLVDSILVPHTAFEEAQRRIGQCMAYVKGGASEPVCVALTGESRTGKSRCIEVFQRAHQSQRLADGLHAPVLSISVPSRPTVKALAELSLFALGAPDWERGTESAKTTRLACLMRACGVLVFVADEFHHFVERHGQHHVVQHHVADWLKNLVGSTKVALVVSGLPSLQAVIDQNEQLAGRFMSPVQMPRFDWQDDAHREEWLAILGAFTEGIGSKLDLPALDGDELALRMYFATGGLIGYLTKTLRQAVWDAEDAGRKSIQLRDLAAAHSKAVWSREHVADLPKPFDKKWMACVTPELLSRTKLIGTVAAPVAQRRASPAARGYTQSAASVLAAR
ncbi:MAG TPA: TniB family NTP-binding protein [Rubrivivax sp.]|nr:TniB family NTP-binding protein [Rubrivivax sp.]